MLHRLFDFSFKRSVLQAIGFYLAYNLFLLVGILIVSYIAFYLSILPVVGWNLLFANGVGPENAREWGGALGYSTGRTIGFTIARVAVLLVPVILCYIVLRAKGWRNDRGSFLFLYLTIACSLVALFLPRFPIAFLSLAPVAVLTTRKAKRT